MEKHADEAALFDRALGALSADMTAALVADVPLGTEPKVVCDVGGGLGHVLQARSPV